MKMNFRYALSLVIALLVLLAFAIFVIVPEAVSITLPYRWDNIPVGQKRFVLHQYLGEPAKSTSSLAEKNNEEWIAKRENGEYVLTVFYNPKDSVATNYKLVFDYHLWFFHKQYDLSPKK